MSSMASAAILAFFIFFLAPLPCTGGRYTSIISFGDSVSDTGNALRFSVRPEPVGRLPYGETFFGHATGRYSDGRLIIDFMAQAIGLPLVRPYLAGGSAQDFRQGVNFAVGGANALNNSFLKAKGINVTWDDHSLGTQMQWFKQMLPLLYSSPGSGFKNTLTSSLFLLGEIGVNDYNNILSRNGSEEEIRALLPSVIDEIGSTINGLIHHGAKMVMVEGIFPMGCVPLFLTLFRRQNARDYDPRTGCLKWLNEFSEYHNSKLLEKISCLRKLHPHATIIYGDIYAASISIHQSPKKFGITVPLAACCGHAGPYNFAVGASCGDGTSNLCSDPSRYVSWDGMHFTEAAHRIIAHGLLKGLLATHALNWTCLGCWKSFLGDEKISA